MSKISLMREALVYDLTREIEQNLEKYRTGDFQYLMSDSSNFIETDYEINEQELAKIEVVDGDFNEVQCCLGAFNGLPNISAYLARDQRLWAYLTHIVLLPYTRQRWPIPQDKEKAIAHIKKHFFASGARGIERDNAISRLWWMASIFQLVHEAREHGVKHRIDLLRIAGGIVFHDFAHALHWFCNRLGNTATYYLANLLASTDLGLNLALGQVGHQSGQILN
jgi:hypothetical protein